MLALGNTRADFRVTRASKKTPNSTADSDTEGSLVNGFESRGIDRSKIRRAHSSRNRSGRGSTEHLDWKSRPSSVLGCPEGFKHLKDQEENINNNAALPSSQDPSSFRRSHSFNTKVLPASRHSMGSYLQDSNAVESTGPKAEYTPKPSVVSASIDSKKSKPSSSFSAYRKKDDDQKSSMNNRLSSEGKVSGIYGSVPRNIFRRSQDTQSPSPSSERYAGRSKSFRNTDSPVATFLSPRDGADDPREAMKRTPSLKTAGVRSVSMDRRTHRSPVEIKVGKDESLKVEKDTEIRRSYNLVRGCSVDSRSKKNKEDLSAKERRKYLIHSKSDRHKDSDKVSHRNDVSDLKSPNKSHSAKDSVDVGRGGQQTSISHQSHRSSERRKSDEKNERNLETRNEFSDSTTCSEDKYKSHVSHRVSGIEGKFNIMANMGSNGIRRTSSLRIKELQPKNSVDSTSNVTPMGPAIRRVNSMKLRQVENPDSRGTGLSGGLKRYSSRGSINKIDSESGTGHLLQNGDHQSNERSAADNSELSTNAHGGDLPSNLSKNVSAYVPNPLNHTEDKPVIMPRRRRKLPQMPTQEAPVLPSTSPTPSKLSSTGNSEDVSSGDMSDCDSRTSYEASSSGFYPSDDDNSTDSVEDCRQNNSTGTTNNARAELTPSPGVMRKSYPPQAKTTQPEKSPTTTRRKAPQPPGSTGSLSGSLSRQSSISDTCTTDTTPPSSPVPNRRHGNREENVFSRLTSQTKVDSPVQDRGSIKPVGRLAKSSPLVHTHTASGHSRAVLSVFATDELLFSSSKDRTGKMWDLNTGQEMLTLSGHPNNVVAIRYSEETRLVYTVSTYYIKVWDTRTGNKCIKTLTSSGMTSDGALTSATTSRQVTCPPGETNINDVAVNSTGAVLYSAAGSTVRIWDLRGFKPVGKLSGGHQAAVMVLAVDDTDTAEGNICVVTGSKDHYIKVFEMDEDSTGVMTPKCNLEPPHYDGIQSLCLMGDLLFSGSRDMCIKKWNLAEQQLAQSINNAHKDWVCGLSFMPGGNCLLSGCRGGIVKLWHIDTCNLVGEVKAHSSPINSVATNSCLIFTASNEGGIKIWEPAWDLLPEYVQDFYS